VAWMGFDTPKTLGRNETGGNTALPIWMGYMGAVLKGTSEQSPALPTGVVAARIDPDTGLRVGDGQPGVTDYFYHEFLPPDTTAAGDPARSGPSEEVRNQLF